MDNYVIVQPYQHVAYSTNIGNFDLVIDIEFEGGVSTILISSVIGSVVFYSDKIQRTLDFETSKLFYMNDELIQDIIDLCTERLTEVQQIIKGV